MLKKHKKVYSDRKLRNEKKTKLLYNMKPSLVLIITFLCACSSPKASSEISSDILAERDKNQIASLPKGDPIYPWLPSGQEITSSISSISPPKGYVRSEELPNSFAEWLRYLPTKPEGAKVFLYNGEEKYAQSYHAAVIDIDVGNRDLQQCADAVMRLRAEYLYSQKKYDDIHFNFTNGQNMPFSKWKSGYSISVKGNKASWVASSSANASYQSFKKYMTWIFSYAGTASLSKELKPIPIAEVKIGDVFIKGGFPGHAVIVVDRATKKDTGEKMVMLAQSYMPAQSIHVLVNPLELHLPTLGPWYPVEQIEKSGLLVTPEWRFKATDLKRF